MFFVGKKYVRPEEKNVEIVYEIERNEIKRHKYEAFYFLVDRNLHYKKYKEEKYVMYLEQTRL